MVQQRRRRSSAKDSATTPTAQAAVTQAIPKSVSLAAIKPSAQQPRRSFNAEKMKQLTESVRQYGILEPLIVRPVGPDVYELVAGERRYRAAAAVGLTEVPVMVHELDDRQAIEIALLENLQRDDLNPIDETEGMLDLLCQSLDCSRQEVISLMNRAANAQRRGVELTDNDIRRLTLVDHLFTTVGRSSREGFRTNRLPLLNLPEDALEFLRQGTLEYTKVKAIVKVKDQEQRQKLLEAAVTEKLSLSEINARVAKLLPQQDSAASMKKQFKELAQMRSDAWKDEQKQTRLQQLMNEISAILLS